MFCNVLYCSSQWRWICPVKDSHHFIIDINNAATAIAQSVATTKNMKERVPKVWWHNRSIIRNYNVCRTRICRRYVPVCACVQPSVSASIKTWQWSSRCHKVRRKKKRPSVSLPPTSKHENQSRKNQCYPPQSTWIRWLAYMKKEKKMCEYKTCSKEVWSVRFIFMWEGYLAISIPQGAVCTHVLALINRRTNQTATFIRPVIVPLLLSC